MAPPLKGVRAERAFLLLLPSPRSRMEQRLDVFLDEKSIYNHAYRLKRARTRVARKHENRIAPRRPIGAGAAVEQK